MDLIVGHQNLDFDCVASMVAAKKLHPSGRIYLQPTAEGKVLEYLNLYRHHFSFFRFGQYHEPDPGTVVVVDTNRRSRLGPYAEALDRADRVVLYDHHPPDRGDIVADEVIRDSVGALVTLMWERLEEAQIEPTPFEATLFLLGLHQETGSLQFGSTTERDYGAGMAFMRHGADLDVVQNFIHRRLSGEQLELFNELLTNARQLRINDVPVTFSTGEREEYVPEIALLAHRLQDTENSNFLCVMVRMGDRVQMVFRNRYDHVDVGRLAEQFGGGGHPRAASATVSGVTLEETEGALRDLLQDHLKPQFTAEDIMTSPAHSVRPDLPVSEARSVMLRLGHHGLPVTDEDDNLVGIITRSDIDKSLRHDLSHAPVKGFMNPEVVTVDPDTGLQQLQDLLMREQIGRLPVVDGGRLVGMVTRTDIIRVMHRQHQSPEGDLLEEPPAYSSLQNPENLEPLMERVLPGSTLERFREWGRLAEDLDDALFLVGGCVRDLLLEEVSVDYDFTLERDAIAFARRLAEVENGRVSPHEPFETAVVTLPDGETVDFATARSEYYSHPAALPDVEVEHASVAQDLRRRDFTINAMAVGLNPGDFGDLLDLYGGRRDLEAGLVRSLYPKSFLDDPTRVFRAVRFAARFSFDIEQRTLFHLRNALEPKLFERVSGDRIRDELDRIFGEEAPWPVVDRLFDLEVLPTLCSRLERYPGLGEAVKRVGDLIERYGPDNPSTVYYCVLFEPLSRQRAARLARRLTFRREQVRAIERNAEFADKRKELEAAEAPSRIYRLLESVGHREVLLARMALDGAEVRSRIARYLERWVHVEPLVDGGDLKTLGIPPGERMGEILEELFDRQLDRDVTSREELLDYVREHHADLVTS